MLDSVKPLWSVLSRYSVIAVKGAVAHRRKLQSIVWLEFLNLRLEVLRPVVKHCITLELVVSVSMAFD